MLGLIENLFDQPVKSNVRRQDNVQKIATHEGDYYNKHYKLIAIDLSKQQRLDTDPQAIQQIDFTGNQFRAAGATMFSFVSFSL